MHTLLCIHFLHTLLPIQFKYYNVSNTVTCIKIYTYNFAHTILWYFLCMHFYTYSFMNTFIVLQYLKLSFTHTISCILFNAYVFTHTILWIKFYTYNIKYTFYAYILRIHFLQIRFYAFTLTHIKFTRSLFTIFFRYTHLTMENGHLLTEGFTRQLLPIPPQVVPCQWWLIRRTLLKSFQNII